MTLCNSFICILFSANRFYLLSNANQRLEIYLKFSLCVCFIGIYTCAYVIPQRHDHNILSFESCVFTYIVDNLSLSKVGLYHYLGKTLPQCLFNQGLFLDI